MRRSKHFYYAWRHALIRTLPVLLILMLLTIYICNVSVSHIIESTYESQLQALQSGVSKADRMLLNASDLIMYLENENDAKQFLATPGPMENGEQTLDFIDLQNNLHSLTVSNSLFSNIQLYSQRSGALIDSSTISLIPSRYYDRVFQLENTSFAEWSAEYLDGRFNLDIIPAQKCVFYSKADRYIIVAHTYPTGYSRYSVGDIFIFLHEDTLLRNAFDISAVENGLLCAVNSSGEIVFQNDSEYALSDLVNIADMKEDRGYARLTHNGKSMLLIHDTGTQCGLRYFIAMPTEQALASTLRIRTTIFILMILFVVVGLAMIAFCSARLSRPVSKLYDMVSPTQDATSFDDFSNSVLSLISQNENLQEQITQQSYYYRIAVFHDLLLGNVGAEMTPDGYRRQLGIDREYGVYVVMAVVFNDFDEYSEENLGVKMYVREALQSCLTDILGLYDWGYDKFVLLIGLNDKDHARAVEATNEKIAQLSANLHNGFALSLSFFGDICDSLEEVSLAVHHTLTALQRADKDTCTIVQWHRATESAPAGFAYPIEIESQLISSTLNGNSALVQKCFDEIQVLNQPTPDEPEGISNDLLLALRSSWLRLCGERQTDINPDTVPELVDECLRSHGDRRKCLEAVRSAFDAAARIANQKENAEITENQRQIKAYVDANYTNPNMSLIMVADAFHISEVYLSKLFKQITGENFSKYIEQLRMDRANQLLREKKPIKDIATAVGYNSPQVFRRAYKRLYGVSPSDKSFIE